MCISFTHPPQLVKNLSMICNDALLIKNTTNLCLILQMSQSLYHHWGILNPLVVNNTVTHVGESSFISETMAVNEFTGETLVTIHRKLVNMDLLTKKSVPLPKTFVEQFGPYSHRVALPLSMDPFPKPPSTFNYKIEVSHTDMDFLFHANNATYIQYCLNAACKASEAGEYPNFSGDMCFYQSKLLNTLYTGECSQGDTLSIDTWQDDIDSNKIRFVIDKLNDKKSEGNTLFYGILEYHRRDREKLAHVFSNAN